MSEERLARQALEFGDGILWLAPTWVPRPLFIGEPGRRLKPDKRYLYALGVDQGQYARDG